MGYTHYYRHNRPFTNGEWEQITKLAQHMLGNLPKNTSSGGGYYKDKPLTVCGPMGRGEPVVTDEEISLNGDETLDLDHETFTLLKKPATGEYASLSTFCKTNRKPYDLAVTAILLIVTEVAPGAMNISSDGDMRGDDWAAARHLLKKLGGVR